MPILLSIIASPEGSNIIESSKSFGEMGGSIGRSAENYWVLSDPECYLSSCHCKISFEDGSYMLTDRSTNGTFLNGSQEPMGKGNTIQLQNGDEIEISDYKFKIDIEVENKDQESNDFPIPEQQAETANSKHIDFGDPFADQNSNVNLTPIEPMLNSTPMETDPLAALDSLSFNNTLADNYSTKQYLESESNDILNESIDWPQSHAEPAAQSSFDAIPEDWDSAAMPESNIFDIEHIPEPIDSSLEIENSALKKQVEQLKQHITLLHSDKSNVTVQTKTNTESTVINALGLGPYNLDGAECDSLNPILGEMLREILMSMIKVLATRTRFKKEFRINSTLLKSQENNPLKFLTSIDEVLENLFVKKGQSYLEPLAAIKDGFQGISEHQLALLSGVREAFKEMLQHFSPTRMEQMFENNNSKLDVFQKSKNAKKWQHYTKYYQELTEDMDNSFQLLFGNKFIRAYEAEIQQITVSENL